MRDKGFIGLIILLSVTVIIGVASIFVFKYYTNTLSKAKDITTSITLPKSITTKTSSPSALPMGEITIKGTVLENNLGCQGQASCYLTLRTNEALFRVVYCSIENEPSKFQIGDQVEAIGMQTNQNEMSVCEKESYFVKKI